MPDHDLKAIITEVLAEQKRLTGAETEEAIQRTISTMLTSFGIEEEDRAELRADFIHLRKWRKSVEQAQSLTIRAMVTIIVAGAAGALWLRNQNLAARESGDRLALRSCRHELLPHMPRSRRAFAINSTAVTMNSPMNRR